MTDQNLIRSIEDAYLRYYRRRRDQVALTVPNAERESNFRWSALYSLLDDGVVPDSFHAVDFEEGIAILVLIDSAAHLIKTSDTGSLILSVGPLAGGVYEERISVEDGAEVLAGTFRHSQLPAPLGIHTGRWDEDKAAKATRELFRKSASVPFART
jgi:hypothetical protein